MDASFPMLRKMGAKLDQLEDDIFEGRSAEIVRDLSNAKQEIINFRRVVRPMRAVLRDLERTKQRYLQEDLDIYFDDITDAAERIWDVLENYKEVAEALEDSNESVLSHRLNDSLRILTAFSVLLLPLTLIASIGGMNVDLPGDESIAEFWLIIGDDGGDPRRPPVLLPPARLPVASASRRWPRAPPSPVVDAAPRRFRMTPARRLLGSRGLSAAVYGSLLVTALIARRRRGRTSTEPFVAMSLFVTVGVFWAMEVWAELVAVRLDGHLTLRQGARVALAELPMIAAAVAPALALWTHRLGLTTSRAGRRPGARRRRGAAVRVGPGRRPGARARVARGLRGGPGGRRHGPGDRRPQDARPALTAIPGNRTGRRGPAPCGD